MTKDELLIEIGKNVPYFINYAAVRDAVEAYSSASNGAKQIVSGSLPAEITLMTVDDDFCKMEVTTCCKLRPIINEKYCPNCGKKITRQ